MSTLQAHSYSTFRFGDFELDVLAYELRRCGQPVHLERQPMDLLILLVQRRGQLVSRADIVKRLWDPGVCVDFETAVHTAMRKLRQALRDSRDAPVFVETISGKGYRFIAPVDEVRLGSHREDHLYIETIAGGGYQFLAPVTESASRATSADKAVGQSKERSARLLKGVAGQRRPLALAGPVALIAIAGLVWFATHRSRPPQPEPKPRRLTANPAGNPATDAHISPDGKYVAYADRAGIHIQLIDTAEDRTIPRPQALGQDAAGWSPVAWFPDGTKLLAQATSLGAEHSSIWVISILGGAPHEIHEGGFAWSVSANGLLIAFAPTFFHSDIWVMAANGDDPRKVVTANEGESLNWVVWSPDSRRIAYERFRFGPAGAGTGLLTYQGVRSYIEVRDLVGGQSAVVLSVPKLPTGGFEGGFSWLADGRLIYSRGEAVPGLGSPETNLWQIRVDARSGKRSGEPKRITNLTDFNLANPSAAADGKRLVFCRINAQADVYIGDLEAGQSVLKLPPRRLTWDERNDWPMAWTPDSKTVLFDSDRSGNWHTYRQALDQDLAEPVVASPRVDFVPQMSPDGAWMLYASIGTPGDLDNPSAAALIRRVAVSGGPSQLVLTAQGYIGHQCARAPATFCVIGERTGDQKQLVFTAFDPIKGRGREVTRVETERRSFYNWGMSPDGSQIAIVFPPGENRIRLLPLAGAETRDLIVKGWYGFRSVDWAPDGKGFYVGSSSVRGATLLYIDLKGDVTPVWEQKGSFRTWAVPSRDGHHLAILGYTVDSSVWMLENF
jgi:DNA-binding winged helix-turn-helix (wHTH) protein/Tol biopolymer transport system component